MLNERVYGCLQTVRGRERAEGTQRLRERRWLEIPARSGEWEEQPHTPRNEVVTEGCRASGPAARCASRGQAWSGRCPGRCRGTSQGQREGRHRAIPTGRISEQEGRCPQRQQAPEGGAGILRNVAQVF